MFFTCRSLILAALVFAITLSPIAERSANAEEWKQYKDIKQAGWSATELEQAKKFATQIGSAAILIVDHGVIVQAWGAIDHPFKAASIRKSVYDATIGATHFVKPFDINTTLAKLGIDDVEPLSETEKSATFEQLLTARSGVYHPAAYETQSNANRRPERGSAKPGLQWYYNNWDFNVSCAAFERLTGESMEQAFYNRLAKPLGMEDFKPGHIFNWLEPRVSKYPAVTFRLSARDLARIGTLYLQHGQWNDQQMVSPEWVKRSTEPITTFESGHYRGEGSGYGRLWWIFPVRKERNSSYQAYDRVAARGTGGQIMVLIPDLDVVIVHLADTDSGRGVSDRDGVNLMDKILDAHKDKHVPKAVLRALHVEKLSGKTPQPLHDDLTPIPDSLCKTLEGRYSFTEQTGMELYQYENRLFVHLLGIPLPDAEFLQTSKGTLLSPVAMVVLEPIKNANGQIETVRMTFRGQTQTGTRVK